MIRTTKATEVCIIEGGVVMSIEESKSLNDGNFEDSRKGNVFQPLALTKPKLKGRNGRSNP